MFDITLNIKVEREWAEIAFGWHLFDRQYVSTQMSAIILKQPAFSQGLPRHNLSLCGRAFNMHSKVT